MRSIFGIYTFDLVDLTVDQLSVRIKKLDPVSVAEQTAPMGRGWRAAV
jgi:hypothetical protein